MKELGSCVAPISGEHIISEGVARVLMGDGDFSVGGLPCLAPDEVKILAPKSLRTNSLCTKHNSALHPLDDAAQYFFCLAQIIFGTGCGIEPCARLGHDIERWLLKTTAKTAAVSKNLARGRTPLSGAFSQDATILDMLDDPHRWPEGAGLYCMMNTGDRMLNHSRFQLQPFTNDQEDIEALAFSILGLSFVLLLALLNEGKYPFLRGAKYRPARLVVSYPSSTNWLTMSWEDGRSHEALTMRFMQAVRHRR